MAKFCGMLIVYVSISERAKATLFSIGPAVLNGGVSTFLAFVLLANSKSYGFVMFFRVKSFYFIVQSHVAEKKS
jgi:hypothetical protein